MPAAAYHASGDLVPSGQLMGNLFEQALFITYDVLAMMLRLELGLAVDEMVARHRNVEYRRAGGGSTCRRRGGATIALPGPTPSLAQLSKRTCAKA